MNINQDSANKFVTFEAIIKNGDKGHIVNINFIRIQTRVFFWFHNFKAIDDFKFTEGVLCPEGSYIILLIFFLIIKTIISLLKIGPPSIACDFEESTCGYTRDDNIEYGFWQRSKGGPDFDVPGKLKDVFLFNLISFLNQAIQFSQLDHTLGTKYGYFMSADLGLARLNSIVVSDSVSKPKCLAFYYLLYGDINNKLDVVFKSSISYSIWSMQNFDYLNKKVYKLKPVLLF